MFHGYGHQENGCWKHVVGLLFGLHFHCRDHVNDEDDDNDGILDVHDEDDDGDGILDTMDDDYFHEDL